MASDRAERVGEGGARPSIGVIVTTYGNGRFIDQTLASVAAQQRRPDAVVVVDDASTDDSVARAEAWQAHLPLEVVALPANGGVARARNTGIARLGTDLVAVLDGDDVMLPDHLGTLAALHAAHGGIATPGALFWRPGRPLRPYGRRVRGLAPPRRRQLERLVRRNYVFVASMVARADLDAVGGFTEGDRDQDTTADWDLWLRLVARGATVNAGAFPTMLYRIVPGSMADDPSALLRAEITQLHRSRSYLPAGLTPVVDRAVADRWAQLGLLAERPGARTGRLRRAVDGRGGDWRNRARAVAVGAAPELAGRLVHRRGAW